MFTVIYRKSIKWGHKEIIIIKQKFGSGNRVHAHNGQRGPMPHSSNFEPGVILQKLIFINNNNISYVDLNQ